jgi:hypothetical protein
MDTANLAPGLYPDLTYQQYAAIDAARHSQLKEMAVSPKRYRWALDHPREDTDAFRWGRLVHTAALEPHLLTDTYVAGEHGIGPDFTIWEGAQRRGKAWDAFQAEHDGRPILTIKKFGELVALREKAALVASVLHSDPIAGPMLAAGHREGAVVWVDERTGLRCKARFDTAFLTKDGHLADLKTSARGVDPRGFGRTAASFAYHQQLSFYADGIAAVTGGLRPPVSIIAVESAEPHDVVVYDLDEQTLDLGRQSYHELLVRLEACQRANLWPGVANGDRMLLKLPEWIYPPTEEESWGMGEQQQEQQP